MSDSYATKAQMTTGGKIQLTVQLDDFKPGETVELSGQATQISGAFANFYNIVVVPQKPKKGPDEKDHYYVSVTTSPRPPHKFMKDQDVTVFLRAAKVWVTVLGTGDGPTPMPSPTLTPTPTASSDNAAGVGDGWGTIKQVSDLDGESKTW
jgi:hypothetical protein